MNPMSDALKARRSGSLPPKQDAGMAPAPQGQEGKDPIAQLLGSLDQDSKMKLKQMLDLELENPSEADDGGATDTEGQSPVTTDEKEAIDQEISPELAAEAQDIFRGQNNQLGTQDEPGMKARGLGDKLKASIGKHFKK